MSEFEALIQKATESLDAARSLLRDGYPDFATSRAYYAMFYVAEALLAIMGQSYRKHSAAISAFGSAAFAVVRIPTNLLLSAGKVTISGKPSVDIPPGTLNSAFKQAGLRKQE